MSNNTITIEYNYDYTNYQASADALVSFSKWTLNHMKSIGEFGSNMNLNSEDPSATAEKYTNSNELLNFVLYQTEFRLLSWFGKGWRKNGQ